MGIYDRLMRADVTWEPWDDRWYSADPGRGTLAGLPMDANRSMRVSTVFACVSLKAETLGALPCKLYRRLPNGGKERATDHPLYRVVAQSPNARHTAMDFFTLGETRVNLHGGFLAEKRPVRGGGVELWPLPLPCTRIEALANGRIRFRVTEPGKPERVFIQDEVLYVPDLMEDGMVGLARSVLAREAIATMAAADGTVARYFMNDASGRLLFKFAHVMNDKQKTDFKAMVRESVMGWKNARHPLYIDNGGDVSELGGPEEAAFLIDPRKYQVADIARFFGRIPLFMIGLEEKSTTWGSGIEQQKQGWIDFGMKPSLVRWQQALSRDLLSEDEQEEYFFEFLLDELLHGDLLATVQAMEIERRNGALSPNEWRIIRNRLPRTGGDAFQETPTGAAPNDPRRRVTDAPSDPPPDKDEAAAPDLSPIVADLGARIAAAETREVAKKAARAQADGARWRTWLEGFYRDHRAYATKASEALIRTAGLVAWGAEEIGRRVELSALAALADGVPEDWAERRETEVVAIIDDTLRAGQAARAQKQEAA